MTTESKIADIVNSGITSGVGDFSVEFLDSQLAQDTVPIDVEEIYDVLKTQIDSLGKSALEHLLIRGYALRKLIKDGAGARTSVKVMGFTVHITDTGIQRTDLNLKRLNALAAIKAFKDQPGLETAMYLRLPDQLKEELKDIKMMICPGLHFVYKIAKKGNETNATELQKVFKGKENIKPKIISATIIMDWFAHNAIQIRLGRPVITLSNYGSYVGGQTGSFTNLIANNGWKKGEDMDLNAEESKLVVKITGMSVMPTAKGGVQSRAKAVFDKIKIKSTEK